MTNPDNQPPDFKDNRKPPEGVIFANSQTIVLAIIALVMILVIAFSSHNAPPAKKETAPPPPPEMSQPRIEEYKRRIEEQARKVSQEQTQLAQAKAATAVLAATAEPIGPYDRRPLEARTYASAQPSYMPPPERSPIEQDQEKRNYQSLYASNIALSYRDRNPDDRRSIGSLASALAKPQRVPRFEETDEDAAVSEIADKRSKSYEEINKATGTKYRLFEGTVVETALTNRLDGAFSGPVNCMTTIDIYSHNGQRLLIPAGTRVIGETKRVDAFGQNRLAVVFHRLIMPDGFSLSLDKFRGLSQIGETGLKDQINHHYLQVFGASIAIGAIGGLAQANSRTGADVSGLDVYRQGVASSLSQSSLRILDRYLSILPTITIREGQRIKVDLTADLLLPAYENHQMPNEI